VLHVVANSLEFLSFGLVETTWSPVASLAGLAILKLFA